MHSYAFYGSIGKVILESEEKTMFDKNKTMHIDETIDNNSPEEKNEIINGEVCHAISVDEKSEKIIKYLYSLLSKYRLNHHPLDKIADPYNELVLADDTKFYPAAAITMNGSDFPDWVIEITSDSDDELTYLRKTSLYKSAGIREYWIINPNQKIIITYFFEKNNFIPAIYDSPRRIRVSIYKDLFISFSEIFK